MEDLAGQGNHYFSRLIVVLAAGSYGSLSDVLSWTPATDAIWQATFNKKIGNVLEIHLPQQMYNRCSD